MHREHAQPQHTQANIQQPVQNAPARRTWHRPELQRLRVSVDTAQKGGSNSDGFDLD